jgi:hypothetical protein
MLVGFGGFFIAVKETYELTKGLAWPLVMFWVLVVVMLAVCVGNVAARSVREERSAARRRARSTSAG